MIPKIIHQIYFDFHNKKIEDIPLFNTSSKRIQEFKNKAYTKVVRIIKTNRPYAIK